MSDHETEDVRERAVPFYQGQSEPDALRRARILVADPEALPAIRDCLRAMDAEKRIEDPKVRRGMALLDEALALR